MCVKLKCANIYKSIDLFLKWGCVCEGLWLYSVGTPLENLCQIGLSSVSLPHANEPFSVWGILWYAHNFHFKQREAALPFPLNVMLTCLLPLDPPHPTPLAPSPALQFFPVSLFLEGRRSGSPLDPSLHTHTHTDQVHSGDGVLLSLEEV